MVIKIYDPENEYGTQDYYEQWEDKFWRPPKAQKVPKESKESKTMKSNKINWRKLFQEKHITKNDLLGKVMDILVKNPRVQIWINSMQNIRFGYTFIPSNQNSTIDPALGCYRFNDIQQDDVVLDIGANVGGYALFVSKMVKHVYAVEPIMTKLLCQNIELNNIKNVSVISNGLGCGIQRVNWGGITSDVQCLSLHEIIELCSKTPTILKCNAEGAEYCMTVEELRTFRRIEVELHNTERLEIVAEFQDKLLEAGFEYKKDQLTNVGINDIAMIHAWMI